MNEELKKKLAALGMTEEGISKLETEGVQTEEDMILLGLTAEKVKELTGCNLVVATKVSKAFSPVKQPDVSVGATATFTAPNDPNAPIPEGAGPSAGMINQFAGQFGIDPAMFSTFMVAGAMGGTGMDFDISSMIPVASIAPSYNPKVRNMSYLVMGQIEKRLGTPIIVINENGSVNPELTAKYVMSLEEGFESAADNIYYDDDGVSYEIIKVGVDAQSVYDADPLDSTKALQQSGMGIGRINWNKVPLEIKQIVFYAVRNGELNPRDDTKLSWLRTNIKPDTTRTILRPEFPKAIADYNEGLRTGSLPTLRVQLSRGARKPEIMPRRRSRMEADPAVGGGFRGDE